MTLTVGSLFSGIGGLELGLERAGMSTIWQCERDPHARAVLATNFPGVPCYDDVTTLDGGAIARPSVLCGGFPCQDLSHAGKRAGLAGERSGLWFEFQRLIGELGPDWVVIENVHQAWRAWVPVVRLALHELGYASLPLRLSAAEVGAPHQRRRAFVVAHANGELLRDMSGWWRGPRGQGAPLFGYAGAPRPAPDAYGVRELQPQGGESEGRGWARDGSRWSVEPPVPGVAHGIPARLDRERLIGNAVSPQVSEEVGRLIVAAELALTS